MTSETTQQIAIKQLCPSQLNQRKSQATKAEDDQLKASIKAHGIKQNLIVFPGKKKGTFEVVAGGRRYDTLAKLVKEKHFKSTDTVPCQVAASESEAIELSIVENTHRAAMHPADEFEAYQALQRTGATIKAIAERFGVTQKHVRQRLKLAGAAPEIIQAYRDKKLDLDAVKAFTVEESHEKQVEVLEYFTNDNFAPDAHHIRQRLTLESIRSNDGIARFIDMRRYKKLGGTVSSDLFGDVSYLNQPELVHQLAIEKLEQLAEEIADGWLWHETHIKLPEHNYVANMAPITGTPKPELTAERQKLDEEFLELEERWEDLSDQEQQHMEELEAKVYQLDEQIERELMFKPEEMALAGFIVTLSRNGEPEFHMGRVRTPERQALKALQTGTDNGEESTDNTEFSPPTETATEELNEYSKALVSDLGETRRTIAQAHLARHPVLAADLLHYTLCYNVLGPQWWSQPISLSTTQTFNADQHPTVAESDAVEHLQNVAGTMMEWIHIDGDAERFRAFQAMDADVKADMVAYCTATLLNVSLVNKSGSDITEEVISQMEIDWHQTWSPTKKNFLERVGKPILIDLGKQFLPAEWEAEAEKRKKGDLAEELENVFNGNDDRLSEEQAQAAAQWMPPGF
ncbi:ParB N-terminal domain-containing protein [Pseudomaricurvus alkylphenolicus]|uniref:ParB/RepB/Spo0J family partition protein n=1 Tax=Pseudomaricurvus alkylphenolicus TaxID=1306991 RepID=UPI00141E9043|nr:ParB/RepB/Spo0J family partition protein [Pseudomaricurvus alkylphenolicus]NIB44844.1 ParB N-terminal domain-containing protein [Pseudomaricurvus alkylphenolicus]